MISLTADDTRLLKDLGGFLVPVEVYGPSGKLLGLFVPANPERGNATAQMDPDELSRRKGEKPAGLFSDVVKRVQTLTEESKRRNAAGEKDFTLEEARASLRGEAKQQPAEPGS